MLTKNPPHTRNLGYCEVKYAAYKIDSGEKMTRNIVALLSDFGSKDPYVAEMKAVILNKCPDAQIIDISHEINKFDIRMGAFVLASAAPYFPQGTVHVAVVDPGVGTNRRPIVVETHHSHFVGPDNGVLMLAAQRENLNHVYMVENPRTMLPKVSKTFHGRDIFAPAAAHLAKGYPASKFGKEIKDFVVPDFAKPVLVENVVLGQVLHIDGFGNIITNVAPSLVKKVTDDESEFLRMEIGKVSAILRLCSAYGDVSQGEPLAIIGSHNFLEISVNQGNAAERFNAKSGDSVKLWR